MSIATHGQHCACHCCRQERELASSRELRRRRVLADRDPGPTNLYALARAEQAYTEAAFAAMSWRF